MAERGSESETTKRRIAEMRQTDRRRGLRFRQVKRPRTRTCLGVAAACHGGKEHQPFLFWADGAVRAVNDILGAPCFQECASRSSGVIGRKSRGRLRARPSADPIPDFNRRVNRGSVVHPVAQALQKRESGGSMCLAQARQGEPDPDSARHDLSGDVVGRTDHLSLQRLSTRPCARPS